MGLNTALRRSTKAYRYTSFQAALAAWYQAALTLIKFADGFFVPHNVFVITTMNEFEGRAEQLDSAVWRHFVCYELKFQDRLSMLKEANLNLSTQVKGDLDKHTACGSFSTIKLRRAVLVLIKPFALNQT